MRGLATGWRWVLEMLSWILCLLCVLDAAWQLFILCIHTSIAIEIEMCGEDLYLYLYLYLFSISSYRAEVCLYVSMSLCLYVSMLECTERKYVLHSFRARRIGVHTSMLSIILGGSRYPVLIGLYLFGSCVYLGASTHPFHISYCAYIFQVSHFPCISCTYLPLENTRWIWRVCGCIF